jgi:nucleotide-binding universal stress UspA family protein
MKKIRKIMVAIDLSEYSKDILEYAGFLAKTTESELVIVSVINRRDTLQKAATEISGFSVNGWLEKEKEARLATMQKLIEETG